MNECCTNQTTPYCGTCGANLKAHTLVGLKEDLERRLAKSLDTVEAWKQREADTEFTREAVEQGIARNSAKVEQFKAWIKALPDA